MRKLSLMLAFLFTMGMQVVFAQTTISGTVTDDKGEPVPGANIRAKGYSDVGTISDLNGQYNLSVPAEATTLVFSFVGMAPREVDIAGKSVIDVTLETEDVGIEQVIVTAIGISRKEKELGYSVTSVSGDELVKARENNVVNSLAGKVSGVRISSQSGGIGGSAKIIIRGANSLDGDNQPLFVVDGMPISNDYFETRASNGLAGAVDYGNRASDLNPDDIESMNVLKGAAATALYGARAKNGAIIITTKRGKAGKLNINVNSSFRMDNVTKLPEYQNEYAQGTKGNFNLKSTNGWGPKISDVAGQTFTDFKGDEVELTAKPGNVEDFFKTGYQYMNSIDLSGGSENGDFRLSFSNVKQDGIIPNSELVKNNFSINAGRKVNDWLSARVSLSYIRSQRDGLSAQGSNDANTLMPVVLRIPRTVSMEDLRNNYMDPLTGSQIYLDGASNASSNNPYWIVNNNPITSDINRYVGSASLTANPMPWLNITNRTGLDYFTEGRSIIYKKGTAGEFQGRFLTDDYYNRILNNDFIVDVKFDINSDFKIKGLLGHNIYQEEYNRVSVDAKNLTVDELYNYSNAAVTTTTNFNSNQRLMGVYADIGLEYKDMLFLNITGRNDWSSTLPKGNNSYFYPSVSLGFIFTELVPANDILTFGKLRLNWANVGSDEDPYQLDFQYTAASTYYIQFGLSNNFPHGNIIGFSAPRILPNQNLKPQNQLSQEAGLDLRFFNGRINFDFTYYNILTTDQIVAIDVPLSTGYFSKNVNVGEVSNKGFEIDFGLKPIVLNGFEWKIDVMFNKNKQVVEKLAEGIEDYNLKSGWSGLQIKAKEGESFGINGTGWRRNDDGEIIINQATGLKETESDHRFGNVDPDWTMGINNSFSYKGFNLSFLIDIRQGGVLYSGTVAMLRGSGLAIETLEHRGEEFIDQGVNEIINGQDISYVANTVPVVDMEDYWGNNSAVANTEGSIFDASYIKFRELRLSYQLPKKWLGNYFQGITVAVEGRNLWILKDHVPHIDPELNFFGPAAAGGGVEFNSLPSSRSIGFNIKLSF